MQSDKLKNFPKVYYISLEESVDRRENLEKQFAEYGITPTAIVSKRWAECDDVLKGLLVDGIDDGTKGALVSHIKMVKKWYEETNDEWGFFCEDDISLETVKYWDFTWNQFMDKVPKDAVGVQMLVITKNFETFDLRKRKSPWYNDDFGATAYILKRNYAKKIIDKYCVSDSEFKVELYYPPFDSIFYPLVESSIFGLISKEEDGMFYGFDFFYTIPLFVENVSNFSTTFVDHIAPEKNQKEDHCESAIEVLNYWKNKGLNHV